MKETVLLFLLTFIPFVGIYAQPRTLRVVYEEELKYAKPYLQSTDAVLRNTHIALVDKKNENKDLLVLTFRDGLYSYKLFQTTPATVAIGNSSSTMATEDAPTYINFNTGERYSIRSIFLKNFAVKDTLTEDFDWALSDDEKVIAGKLCKKATMRDDAGEVTTAWYCPEIPSSVDPDGYYGLLGLIMQLDVPSEAIYTVQSVEYTDEAVDMGIDSEAVVSRAEFKRIQEKKTQELGGSIENGIIKTEITTQQ